MVFALDFRLETFEIGKVVGVMVDFDTIVVVVVAVVLGFDTIVVVLDFDTIVGDAVDFDKIVDIVE